VVKIFLETKDEMQPKHIVSTVFETNKNIDCEMECQTNKP